MPDARKLTGGWARAQPSGAAGCYVTPLRVCPAYSFNHSSMSLKSWPSRDGSEIINLLAPDVNLDVVTRIPLLALVGPCDIVPRSARRTSTPMGLSGP